MRLFLVLHVLVGSVFVAATAIGCRLLFLIPLWLGAVLGVVLYTVIIVGTRAGDPLD